MIAGAAAHRPRTGSVGALGSSKERESSSERPTTSQSAANRLQVPNQPGNALLSVTATRRRAGSVPLAKFTLATAWSLKAEYVRALKTTWARLCDAPRANCRGIVGIVERVFEKFDQKDKRVREVFYQSAFIDQMADRHGRRHSDNSIATLRDHIQFLISLISQVIQALDQPPTEIFDHLDRLGTYHNAMRNCGFQSGMFDKLGVCLIDAIVVQDTVRSYPEGCKSWTLMLAALIDRLRSARKQYGAPLTLRGPNRYFNRNSLLVDATNVGRCPSPSPGRQNEKPNGSPRSSPHRTTPSTYV
ncbi:Globin-like protein 9 [Aphelenchoides fujianensis]|nr:Globin-like protein 9 [Aphelenchoides fujianensis]